MAVINQSFAECTTLRGMNNSANDGILGLAYSGLAYGNATPFFYNMWAQGVISKPIFSFYLNPSVFDSVQPRRATIHVDDWLGIKMLPTVVIWSLAILITVDTRVRSPTLPWSSKATGKSKWTGKFDRKRFDDTLSNLLSLGSVTVGSTVVNTSLYAIADTSTTFIVGPVAAVTTLNEMLGGTYDSYAAMVRRLDRGTIRCFSV